MQLKRNENENKINKENIKTAIKQINKETIKII